MATPSLEPVPPTRGTPLALHGGAPLWIGSAADCAIQLFVPGVAAHHAGLMEREDGWWIVGGNGPASVNGRPLAGTVRLPDDAIIEIAPGYRYCFRSGVARPEPAPVPAAPAPRPKRRRRHRDRGDGSGRWPWGAIIATVLVVVLLAAAGGAIWFALRRADRASGVMTDEQADRFDSLLVVAYDHIERGSTLLELGLGDVAGQEFARGVNTLALSDLRNHPQVKPRIEALEASIAAIYRDRRLTVPKAYSGKASTLTPDQLRTATLTVAQFAAAFAQVDSAFEAQFGTAIVVSGRDHAEHVALYGPGGALDLRTRDLPPEQVHFITEQCRARGIRVKDFSQDAVLQDQIRSAIRAGLLDRLSTGLHLHIDRFGGRHDRFTVSLDAEQRATSPET